MVSEVSRIEVLVSRTSPRRQIVTLCVGREKEEKEKRKKRRKRKKKKEKKKIFVNRIKQYFIYLLIRYCWRHISEKPLWVGKNLRASDPPMPVRST